MHPIVPLIKLKKIEKAFRTDEIETHPLSGVNLEIHRRDCLYKEELA
jgi:hypothetical protein